MMHNDNIRDMLAWELPEVKEIGVCLDCQQLKEIEEGGFCLDCLIEIDNLVEYSDEVNQDYLVLLFGERI